MQLAVTPIGRAGVRVTRLGLGTGPLGGWPEPVPETEALGTITAAYRAGIRYFDTAPLYGYGRSEECVGRALQTFDRREYFISTKVGRVLAEGVDPSRFFRGTGRELHPEWDFSYAGVRRSLEASLARMSLDHIDIALLHDPDKHLDQALEEAYPALVEMRAGGVIGAIGAGMNRTRPLTYLMERADLDCVLIAGRYTLLDQEAAHELLPMAIRRGVSVIVGGVYNSGILTNPSAGATYDYAAASSELIGRASAIEEVCLRHGVSLKAAALQFALLHPAVSAVVTGARSSREVEENVALLEVEIPAELWSELRARGLLDKAVPLADS